MEDTAVAAAPPAVSPESDWHPAPYTMLSGIHHDPHDPKRGGDMKTTSELLLVDDIDMCAAGRKRKRQSLQCLDKDLSWLGPSSTKRIKSRGCVDDKHIDVVNGTATMRVVKVVANALLANVTGYNDGQNYGSSCMLSEILQILLSSCEIINALRQTLGAVAVRVSTPERFDLAAVPSDGDCLLLMMSTNSGDTSNMPAKVWEQLLTSAAKGEVLEAMHQLQAVVTVPPQPNKIVVAAVKQIAGAAAFEVQQMHKK
eukprot:gene5014-5255_t